MLSKIELVALTTPSMEFDLGNLVHLDPDIHFDTVEAPFTNDEIDDIVKNMPKYKSLGINGFNGAFLI
jgi:hypothetical protein